MSDDIVHLRAINFDLHEKRNKHFKGVFELGRSLGEIDSKTINRQ